jgi:hypothetical protein
MLRGDWLRRLLALAVLVVPVLWWLIGLGALPYPRFVGPDPVTLAYSLPQQAAIMLLVPAVVMAGLAFLPHRPDTRVRLRRVHPEQPTYRQPGRSGKPPVIGRYVPVRTIGAWTMRDWARASAPCDIGVAGGRWIWRAVPGSVQRF